MEKNPQSANSQDAVFRLLEDRATYGGAEVRRFDTHAAVVFLAGDRAIKVKRAVRYPFLDYSTLDKRYAACRAELDVNRRFAPQLYRRVVPISRQPDGSLALDGATEPIEWAVEMERFDEDKTLDHLAARGELDDALMQKLAVSVAAMHARAEPADADAWIDALGDYIHNNTATFTQHRDLFAPRAIETLERESLAALERLRPLLRARGEQGLIRRGHGDLHLGNIAVLDGEPVAFDALEFDAIIASGDVLYDLAFLLMDLLETANQPAANLVLNGYFGAARRDADYDGIAALTFFMSLRAALRAMTTASRCEAVEDNVAQSAKRYFDLALRLLAPEKPIVVCIGGLSGTGKSLLARGLASQLAPLPGALVLRSDVERKAMFGIAEYDRLPDDAYRPNVTQKVYRGLSDKAARVGRAGYSVIVDAVFAKSEERAAIEVEIAAAAVDVRGLFLVADLPTRLNRVGSRGPDASDAGAKVAREQDAFEIGPLTWATIDASGSLEETLVRAAAAIE